MDTKTKAIVGIVTLAVLVAGAGYRAYEISGGSGGWALWDANEAYFFIQVSDLGYNWNGLQYPWILFKRYVIGGFAAAEFPTDQRACLVVLRVTTSAVERHVLKLASRFNGGPGSDPEWFTPLEDRIYAFCPALGGQFMQDGHLVGKDMNDGLCWGAGDHFEKATEPEKMRLDGISHLTKADFADNGTGWSRLGFGAEPNHRKFMVDVGDKFRLSVNNVAAGTGNSTVSIDLLRPGKRPERIGTFEARLGRISRSEYRSTFGGRE